MALGKKILAAGLVVACSVAVFAASKAPVNGNTKMKGSTMNGKRPLKMQSEDKMTGRVKSVDRIHEPDGVKVHITLQTPEGMRKIVVGPASYMEKSQVALQTGDKVTVYGYEVSANGDQMWIATRLEKNGKVVQMRQENGAANWHSNREGNPRMKY